MKKWDVLGLGCATLDEMFFVESFPAPDSKTRIQRSEKQGGGLTMTALVAAARIGAQCAYGGMLGPDEISAFVATTMEQEGIDTSLIAWRDEAAAIRSTIIVDTTHHSRTIFFERNGLLGAAPDTPSEAEIAASRVLLVDHYGGAGNVRAMELARYSHVPIVADFERTDVEHFEAFFPLADHLILSRGFASRLTGQNEIKAILDALWNDHRQVVAVTDGENGVWALENGQISQFPSFATQLVDTTGCGDVWHGVYAATLAWGWPLEKRARWANSAAALKAMHIGAQKGAPTRPQLELFLKNP